MDGLPLKLFIDGSQKMNPNEFGEPLTFDLVGPTVSLTAATLGYNRGREKKVDRGLGSQKPSNPDSDL